jgi:hypothetical protein
VAGAIVAGPTTILGIILFVVAGVMLVTAAVGVCPLYRMFGMSTCPVEPAAKDRARALLDSPPWRTLSANRDNRVFVVNNEVWQTGQGLVAARGIVEDLRWLNAPIN